MNKLQKKYYNIEKPGSYSGFYSFNNALHNKRIRKEDIKDWLSKQEPYTLHKPIIKKFKRNRVISAGIDDIWQADLVDISKLSRYNKGINYLLTCIDIFSKYAWVIPIKNKSSKSIVEAFQKIFEDRIPLKIQTDKGKEFINKDLKQYFKEKNVTLYTINSDMKACIIERFNRTLKEKMWRYFSHKNSHEYLDILDNLVYSYNNTYHRSIKTKPTSVKKKNEQKIWNTLYDDEDSTINIRYKIQVKVRIVKNKTLFSKGYYPNWTRELFVIDKIFPRNPPVYSLRDLNDEPIDGVFYEQEIQKVDDTQEYKIDKIIKTRTDKGKKQYFVSWLGYPDSFNSWINQQDLV